MVVSKDKWEELKLRMERLRITEEDIVEKFILGSGKGGQKINKTSSCVYLKHLPTGIEIKCQKERSRDLNRYLARRELCAQLEKIQLHIQSEKERENAKIRRQKARRSRKQKQKMIEEKKQVSEKKERRKIQIPDNGF
jgi:protein subunit release factor B